MKTFALDSREFLDVPDRKKFYNEQLFTEVAPKYDKITRLLSFGRDRAWKQMMIQAIPGNPRHCLDLACGTGDLTLMLHERFPDATVTGVDLTPAMLDLARVRPGAEAIRFETGDMGALAFPDASMDLITGGYALRNAPDIGVALAEMVRVLKPGGCLALLDFSKSPSPLRHRLDYALLKSWGGFWGLALHGHADVYGYIAESLKRFPDRTALRRMLQQNKLGTLVEIPLFGGILEAIIYRKTG